VVEVPGTGMVAHDVEISFSGKKDNQILKALSLVEDELKKIKGVHNISDDANIGEKELKLKVNEYGELLGFN
jgi:hypothetical protein